MTEKRTAYQTEVLSTPANSATLEAETSVLRGKLRNIKVQLISLLVEIDRALGDEPSVKTRAERRRSGVVADVGAVRGRAAR